MKHIFFIFLFLSIYSTSYAQFSETISTDRPGQTFSASTLGDKVFQIQTGFTYSEDNSIINTDALVSSTYLRFGLTDRFDIEAMVNWRKDKALTDGEMKPFADGISDTQIGFKYSITENNGWIPALAFQGRVITRLVSEDYKNDNVGMLMNLATSNSLTNWLSYNMNIGVVFPSNDGQDYYVPATFNLGTGISEKWGAFIEMYGNLNDFQPNFDCGLSFLANSNLMFDVSGGFLQTSTNNSWFIDGGLSYRLVWRDK